MKKLITPVLTLLTLLLLGCSENQDDQNDNSGGGTAGSHSQLVYPDTIDALSYCAMGASDVVGEGAIPETKGYVYLIKDSLTNFVRNVKFDTTGVSGHIITEIAANQLPQALQIKPDVISLWTGGNDLINIIYGVITVQIFENNLDIILSSLKDSLPNTHVVIGNLPNLTKLPRFETYSDETKAEGKLVLQQLNRAISTKAHQYGATVVDLASNTSFVENHDNISDDGFHPSNKGYEIMAIEFLREIISLY